MKRLARFGTLTVICGSVVFGQVPLPRARWTGTWALDLKGSELCGFWEPAAPDGQTVIIQALEIAPASDRIKIIADTVTSAIGTFQAEVDLHLDGRETILPGGLQILIQANRRQDIRCYL